MPGRDGTAGHGSKLNTAPLCWVVRARFGRWHWVAVGAWTHGAMEPMLHLLIAVIGRGQRERSGTCTDASRYVATFRG